VVHFVDNPGFLIGVEAESAARSGAACALCAITRRECVVLDPRAQGLRRRRRESGAHHRLNLVAWPSGGGSLPIPGGGVGARRLIRGAIGALPGPGATGGTLAVPDPGRPASGRSSGARRVAADRLTRRAVEIVDAELGEKRRGFRP
jgi:hypothetical protein